jgi:short-subunit dehydrogenase
MLETALITGASAGIGQELARCFAKDGKNVVLVARRLQRLKKLAKELEKEYGIKAVAVAEDLSKADSAEILYKKIEKKKIQVDYLVNNAGFGSYGEFKKTDNQRTEDMINLNMLTLTKLTRLFLPHMIKRKNGGIMNVGSTGSFAPCPMMQVYCATKAYVLSFTEALSIECEGTGVKVSCLCPGATKTEFQEVAGLGDLRLTAKFMKSSKEVAKQGYEALMKNKTVCIPGVVNKLLMLSIRLTPRKIVAKTTKKMLSKDEGKNS